MAIDVNEEVRVWGGLNPGEFWFGCGALLALAGLGLLLGARFNPLVGGAFFVASGAGFVGFMAYRQSLPKGLLGRRFRHDGSFLFLRIPWVEGVDLYRPPAQGRGPRFEAELEGGRGEA